METRPTNKGLGLVASTCVGVCRPLSAEHPNPPPLVALAWGGPASGSSPRERLEQSESPKGGLTTESPIGLSWVSPVWTVGISSVDRRHVLWHVGCPATPCGQSQRRLIAGTGLVWGRSGFRQDAQHSPLTVSRALDRKLPSFEGSQEGICSSVPRCLVIVSGDGHSSSSA